MWYYKNRPVMGIDQFSNPRDLVGFTYMITNTITGAMYIGKKNFYSTKKKKLTLKEIAALPDKRFKHHKHVTAESDWKTYCGSCKQLKADIALVGIECFKKEILEVCCTKKYLSYCELAWQVKLDVLTNPLSYNDNILSRFYRKDMINC